MVGTQKTIVRQGVPIFQRVIENAQGGFTLSSVGLTAGTVLKAGSVVTFDESTRIATVVKSAVLQANATATDLTYRVLKGGLLVVGDAINLSGGTARAITAISTTDPAFDLVTVATSIGVAAFAGDALFVGGATITGAKGLLYEDAEVKAGQEIAVVIRGTVYARRIPAVAASVQSQLPNIIFSNSF